MTLGSSAIAPGDGGRPAAQDLPGWAPEERRFKVFISYSRGDSAPFAAKLVKALEDLGLAAKLDTRDLEFGEKWQGQLKDFIRQADAVVYVVSPRAIASKWCRWELAQVAAQSKRLVPVVHLEVKPEELPAEIGDVQLFLARPGIEFVVDDTQSFAALAKRLADGLQKDRDWLQEHTRLTDLAYTWARGDQSRDHLLRGGALTAAEAWMTRRPGSAPPPSRAHLDFIAASQVAAKRTARRWVIGLSAVTAATTALAAVAWVQRQVAVERQNQALANESRMLVGMAQRATASGDAVEGAQLALAALPDPGGDARPYVAEAERALYAALLEQRERAVIPDAAGARMMQARFSPDGTRVYALSEANRLTIADAATGKIETSTAGTPLIITGGAWSADGRRVIATAMGHGDEARPMDKGYAVLWDMEAGTELAVIDHEQRQWLSASFRADGKEFVLSYERDRVFIHDAAEGRETATIDVPNTDEVASAALSPDGKLVATGSIGGIIRIWDRETKAEVKTLEGHTFRVSWMAFSDDGARLFSAAQDRTARIWDLRGSDVPRVLEGHGDIILTAALSRDEKQLITGSQDKTARLWNLADPAAASRLLEGHLGSVIAVGFSADGAKALTASEDGTARIWDVATAKAIGVLRGHDTALTSAALSEDGQRVLTAGGPTARIWSVDSMLDGRMLHAGAQVSELVFSRDGSRLVAATGDGPATLWDVESRTKIAVLEKHTKQIDGAAFSADGESLVTVGWDETAQRWNAKTGAHIGEIARNLDNWGGKARLDRHGTRLVTSSDGSNAAALWDLASGNRLSDLVPPRGGETFKNVSLAVFSADGSKLATVASYIKDRDGNQSSYANGGSVWLWDARTGQSLGELQAGDSAILGVDFSPALAELAAVSRSGEIRIWSTATGKVLHQLKIDTSGLGGISTTIDISADRALLAAASKNAGSVWDLKTGALITQIATDERQIGRVRFSPDGQLLVTAGQFGIRVWNARTGAELATFRLAEPRTVEAVFSPDGSTLATTRQRESIELLPLYPSTDSLVPAARRAIPRCLSEPRAVSLGLGRSVPRWCITGADGGADRAGWRGRWPFDTEAWRDWLAATDSGKNPAMPKD